MYKAQPTPDRLSTNIIVMRCPKCRELVMLHATRLQDGQRVCCCHCGGTSSVSGAPFPDGAGSYWRLTRA